MASVLGQRQKVKRCKSWLYINRKRCHAILAWCGFTFWMIVRFKDSTITSVQLWSFKYWDHLHNSLTVGFTKHNNMPAAFTTLELDVISTGLTTVCQAQKKPIYLYNELWETCQIWTEFTANVSASCVLDRMMMRTLTAVSLRWTKIKIIKLRGMCLWLMGGWNKKESRSENTWSPHFNTTRAK